jgi:hypothetical protein
MKSTSRIELRTIIPASAINPIIDVAVKGALNRICPMTMPQSAGHRQTESDETMSLISACPACATGNKCAASLSALASIPTLETQS